MSYWPRDLMLSARVVDGCFEFTTADNPVVRRRPLPTEPRVGRTLVRCAKCNSVRWYGFGACSNCGAPGPANSHSGNGGGNLTPG